MKRKAKRVIQNQREQRQHEPKILAVNHDGFGGNVPPDRMVVAIYFVDFIRFYIRDLKTVARMATHEQEILPVYSTLRNKTTIVHKQEIAKIFAFHRFSLSEDQALNVEIYERHGNRHLYLQIKQKDLDDLQTIAMPKAKEGTLAMNNL